MGSTGADRSLSSGLLPQWMKTKVDTRLDLNDAAFSPPSSDDSFFYLRFNRFESEQHTGEHDDFNSHGVDFNKISQAIGNPENNNNIIGNVDKPGMTAPICVPKLSQHTVPCQRYIAEPGVKHDIPKQKQGISGQIRVKSAGTDDGFKGEGAACGTSIIQVANQMVSSKSRLLNPTNQTQSHEAPCETANNVHSDSYQFDPFHRRGSKSLPTTPLQSPSSSPKSRKKLQNRYFTGAFVDQKNLDKFQGSWILAGLLGTRETISASTSTIAEEEILSISDSVDMLADVATSSKEKQPKPQVFRPKPSELREMNFWSPTSM